MKTKHTPGPWQETGNGNGFIRGEGGAPVASVYGDDPECHMDDRMGANCRLIAAAPELLDLVREVVRVLESDSPAIVDTVWVTGGRPETLLDMARAAIAKATGEEA